MNAELAEFSFTEARANLSAIMDDVVNQSLPVVIHRKRSKAVLMERRMLRDLLSSYEMTGEVFRDADDSYSISLDAIDIVENAPTQEAAIVAVVAELRQYARDYIERLPVFLNAPNRKGHYPYVLRILLAAGDEEIREMIKLRHA